jgi:pimeloyl-ACP methyl ester carboxylesterase/DNA-binding winged helix-turn-helix (wHTH) protein
MGKVDHRVLQFDRFALDLTRGCLRTGDQDLVLRPKTFEVLRYLAENAGRLVPKHELNEAVWPNVFVSDDSLVQCIRELRDKLGDDGHRLIKTIPRRGYLLDSIAETRGPIESVAGTTPHEEVASPALPKLHQDVHFCTASDGVRIAYAEVGQGPPLLKAANWLNHLEYDWESPVWSPFLQALAAEHRLIRYDARGNGLSDWEVEDLSLEAFVRDLESVVEAAGLSRFALLGMSQGCAVSIAYAVRHPEGVSHLVLYGGFARGRCKRGLPQDIEGSDAVVTLIRQGWGQDNPACRQFFTSLFMPGATAEQMQSFNDMQRITTCAENAVRLRRVVDDMDVTNLLSRVTAPTLVLHCRNDAMQPFDEGRRIAAGIRGARFVALEGRNHMILQSDPVWSRFFDEVNDFLQR